MNEEMRSFSCMRGGLRDDLCAARISALNSHTEARSCGGVAMGDTAGLNAAKKAKKKLILILLLDLQNFMM